MTARETWREPVVVVNVPFTPNVALIRKSLGLDERSKPSALWAKLEPVGGR